MPNEPEDLVVCRYSGEKDYIKLVGKYEVVLHSGVIATWAGLHKYYIH